MQPNDNNPANLNKVSPQRDVTILAAMKCYHVALIRLEAAWRHNLACRRLQACRGVLQTPTDDDDDRRY